MEVLKTIYEIKIEKHETIMSKRKEYEKIADSGNENDGGAMYAYVSCNIEKTNTTEILIQQLEEIDLPSIIKAINKL